MRYDIRALAIAIAITTAPYKAHCMSVEVEELSAQTIILLKGDVEFGDDAKLASIQPSRSKSVYVALNSNGGYLLPGIKMGRLIRKRGWRTVILYNISHDVGCYSSCALMWLGGVQRYGAPGTKIGFHAPYDPDTRIRSDEGVKAVRTYMGGLGYSDEAFQFAVAAGADGISLLEASEHGISFIKQMGLPTEEEANQSNSFFETSTRLPMDMDRYCKENYGAGSRATARNRRDASSWRCKTPSGLVGMNLKQLCIQQYGEGAKYSLGDKNDAASWACIAASGE